MLLVLTHSLDGYVRTNATVASQNVISSMVVNDTVELWLFFHFLVFDFGLFLGFFFTLNTLSLIKDHEQLHIMQVLRIKSLLFGVVFHNIANNEWYKFILYCFLQIISIKPQFQTKPIVCRWKSTYTDKKTEKKKSLAQDLSY